MSRGAHRLLAILFVLFATSTTHAWPALGAFDSPFRPRSDGALWSDAAASALQCSYSLNATSASVPSTGSTGRSVSVVTGSSCSWTATSNDGWITVISGASGTGLGTVTYNVAANPGTSVRTGTLTIAGITYTVTQAANSCSYSLNATSASVPSTGTTSGAVSVTTGTSCTWTATSNAAWITVTGGASGTGIGTVTYSVAANPSASTRSGTLTIAGLTYTVTQAPASCSYTLSATSASVPVAGSTNETVSVVTGSTCSWTAHSNVVWITVTGGANGTGSGTVSYNVAANPGTSLRTGTLTIAGVTYTVTQAAPTPPNAPQGLRIVIVK
jgi:Putative binding domain, N-terminal